MRVAHELTNAKPDDKRADALKWALTNQIGIEGEQTIDSNTSLRILVEKDFACLDGTKEQNADTFPNPLAGQKC